MKRAEILDAVKKTITQDRNNRHGEPENSFPRIAEAWTAYLKRRGIIGDTELQASDTAEMLAIFKGVRFEVQPDNPDNEHDRLGYYAIAAELRNVERATTKAEKLMMGSQYGRIGGADLSRIKLEVVPDAQRMEERKRELEIMSRVAPTDPSKIPVHAVGDAEAPRKSFEIDYRQPFPKGDRTGDKLKVNLPDNRVEHYLYSETTGAWHPK